MRILLYDWPSYMQYDVEWVCREKGISAEKFAWKFTDKNEDEQFEKWFEEHVDTRRFDVLFSVNYWPMLSQVAQRAGIRYVAWCYDNPLNVVRIGETLGNPVNRVVFFDRVQAEQYLQHGYETVYYLPLCVNRNRIKQLRITDQERRRFGCAVSLVGSLYESRFQEIRALTEQSVQGYLDAAIDAQQKLYGAYLFDGMISGELVDQINRYIKETNPDTSFRLVREALTFAMASEVTRKDRLMLLSLLGKHFDTRLYSFHSLAAFQKEGLLQGIQCFPPVDYVTEMPQVFACSKVNLNPSLRCIQSGIPLRALDVMGAGGFLLSNYQPELAERFADGEEMVLYESVEDAFEKTGWYLEHEDIRQEIAKRGQEKVFAEYAMQERFEEILGLAGL